MEHCHRDIVLTIRVDRHLAGMLKDVPNRSEFIRDAIRHALARQCPTCGGTGVLSAERRDEYPDESATDVEVRQESVKAACLPRTPGRCSESFPQRLEA